MSKEHESENTPFGNEPHTGHIWDGDLRELTNQPPKWWMYGLHASWIFVLVYCLAYPSWPLLSGHTKGFLGWTSIGEYKKDLKDIKDVRAPFENRINTMSAAQILADSELKDYTVHSARVLFGDNCAACHGVGGSGNLGYPVLADDDWLYGGTLDKIQDTISQGRSGGMPAFDKQLNSHELDTLAQYVLELSKGHVDTKGQQLYMSKGCMLCHGPEGKGNPTAGSANLTDQIWRFAPDTMENIKQTIAHGVNDPSDPNTRPAKMPTFKDRLSETDIKKLSVYVHELGGGQ